MNATVAMTGQGGWPMTCFLTPDGSPFYCGTYYPPTPRGGMPSFTQLLEAIADTFTNRRDEVDNAAQSIVTELQRASGGIPYGGAPIDAELLNAAGRSILGDEDVPRGGFGGAPKFPPSALLEGLLRQYERTVRARSSAASSAPPKQWHVAGSTTSWVAVSRGTRSTPSGWFRTSRRCSTTMRCSCGSTRTGAAHRIGPRHSRHRGDRKVPALRSADRERLLRFGSRCRHRRRRRPHVRMDADAAGRGTRRGGRAVGVGVVPGHRYRNLRRGCVGTAVAP